MANTSKLDRTVMLLKLSRNIEAKRVSLSSNTFDNFMRPMFDAYYAEGSLGEKLARVVNQLEVVNLSYLNG